MKLLNSGGHLHQLAGSASHTSTPSGDWFLTMHQNIGSAPSIPHLRTR